MDYKLETYGKGSILPIMRVPEWLLWKKAILEEMLLEIRIEAGRDAIVPMEQEE